MASATKRLVVNSFAVGTTAGPISIEDPLSNVTSDFINGRVRFSPGAVNEPSLNDQLLSELNLGGSPGGGVDTKVPVSVSDAPNISPFPLGCPSGFYQSGNVCIPNVDQFGSPGTFQSGGQPKAIIRQVIPPTFTVREKTFYVEVLFQNIGAKQGKFFLRVMIPSLNIDQKSPGVWIPQQSNGVLYIQILLPSNAPALQPLSATCQITHMDETANNGSEIVDDTNPFSIPGPGTTNTCVQTQMCMVGYHWDPSTCQCVVGASAPPTTTCPDGYVLDANNTCVLPSASSGASSTTADSCFTVTLPQLIAYQQQYSTQVTIQNIDALTAALTARSLPPQNTSITFCQTASMTDGCVSINGIAYCPTSTHNENNDTSAAIVLSPSDSVKDGDRVTVTGSGFGPNEQISVILSMTAYLVDTTDTSKAGWAGHVMRISHDVTSDGMGAFNVTVGTPLVPAGVKGHATVTAQGSRTSKIATRAIEVV